MSDDSWLTQINFLEIPTDTDSLPPQLFNMMANSKVFLDASIILFLNKTDIFEDLSKR